MPRRASIPTNEDERLEPAERLALLAALTKWVQRAGRDLPWRGERDPYRVWLREVMLQQTTVAAMVPYLERFLTLWPTVAALAAAEEATVLRSWEGLGYYSRARNLHRAARAIVMEHSGRFPETVDGLSALPGIGRYTAAAIASFSFHQPVGIIEANTLRVQTRMLALTGDPRTPGAQRRVWARADDLAAGATKRFTAAEINQALMDLGATVCVPKAPRCEECPLARWCSGFQAGIAAQLPQSAPRPTITEVTEATVAIARGQTYLLRQRQTGERWAGMWDFPRFPIPDEAVLLPSLVTLVNQQAGLQLNELAELASIRHSVTRYRITLRCYTATATGRLTKHETWRWLSLDELADYPLSVTAREFAERLRTGHHQPD